ncbi:MAG: DHHW family protein [Acetanaerobacterium sp.]
MKAKIVSAVFFALFLVGMPLATILSPRVSFSEMENRTLAELPHLTVKSISSRTFMDGVETWFSDHFVDRDYWVSAKGYIEYFTGKRENNGVYICADRLIEEIAPPDEDKTQQNIDGIKAFVEKNKKQTYLMLVPTAAEVYREQLPHGVESWDQRGYIKEVAKKLTGITNEIDIYKVLLENKSEYIYYRTDHHWTTTGAFYAFSEASERMGIHAVQKKNYNIQNVSHDFYGTLYSKVGYRGMSPDIVSLFEKRVSSVSASVEVFDGKETVAYPSMYFTEFLDKKDQYSVFLGQNQPIVTIKTDSESEKSLLIFKDSFAHSLAPFFADYYSTITLVDLRYINQSYDAVLNVENYDQVLLLYNVDTFSHSSDVAKLGISSK